MAELNESDRAMIPTKVFVVLLILAALPCTLISLGATTLASGPNLAYASSLGLAFGLMLQMAGAVTLWKGLQRARPLIVGGAAIAALASLPFIKVFGLFGSLGLWPGAIATAVILTKRVKLKNEFRPLQRRHAVVLGAFSAALLIALVARHDINSFLWELQVDRWSAECEETDAREACGRWAIDLLINAKSDEDLIRGRELFEKSCADDQVHRACVYAAELRTEYGIYRFDGEDDYFHTQRRERLRKACAEKEPGACFAALLDEDDSLIPGATAACGAGDELACYAEAVLRQTPEALRKACDLGFQGQCKPAGKLRLLLYEEHAHESLPATVKAAVNREHFNRALYGVSVADDVEPGCAADDAEACFVLGLNVSADVNPFSDPVPKRSLEPTMGKACELGSDNACYVYGLRLLDVAADEERDETRARELLQTSCDRGHALSCWLIATQLMKLPDELNDYKSAADQLCRRFDRCAPLMHIVAFEAGAEPWLVLDSIAEHTFLDGCYSANSMWACQAAADHMHGWKSSPPDETPTNVPLQLQVRAAKITERGCKAGKSKLCRQMFWFAEERKHLGLGKAAALREKVCPQLPAACEED